MPVIPVNRENCPPAFQVPLQVDGMQELVHTALGLSSDFLSLSALWGDICKHERNCMPMALEVYEVLEVLKTIFCEKFIAALQALETKVATSDEKRKELSFFEEFFNRVLLNSIDARISSSIDQQLNTLIAKFSGSNSSGSPDAYLLEDSPLTSSGSSEANLYTQVQPAESPLNFDE